MQLEEQHQDEPQLEKLGHLVRYLTEFARHPVQKIKDVPDWDWPALVIFYVAAAATCGVLRGILIRHITEVFSGLIVTPIMSVFSAVLVTGLIYYTLVFFFDRDSSLRRIFSLVLLAALPTMILSIVSHWASIITIIGLFLSGLLLVVGVSGNFNIDRKKFGKIIAAIFVAYFLFWIYSSWHFRIEKEKYKNRLTTPASRQILEQELGH